MEQPVLAALLSVEGSFLKEEEKQLFAKYNPLGVTLFKRNMLSLEQTKDLIKSVQEVIGRDDVVIALDQEGGQVNRLKSIGFPSYASQNVLGRIGREDIIRTHGKIISRDMKQVGANFNLAPVLDIDYPQTTQVLKSRIFGNHKNKVSKMGKVLCETYLQEGICPCIKHLPGHGRACVDPHFNLPVISFAKDLENDFYPFQQLNRMPAAMTAHVLIPEIDEKNPVTLSAPCVREIIRGVIGFDGLLLSDALEMHALQGTISERAVQAWEAGCDVILYGGGRIESLESLCRCGHVMTDVSMERFEKVREIFQRGKSTIVLDNDEKNYYSYTSQFADETINDDATEILHQL